MKSLLEYKNLIMSTGLIPAIVCMIFCIFFQDAVVLYVCSLASIIYILAEFNLQMQQNSD